MSSQVTYPDAQQLRSIAWLRIKMMVGYAWRLLALLFGCFLVLVASLGLVGTMVTLVFGGIYLERVTIEPALHIGEREFNLTTWWGICVVVLFNMFVLTWGVCFVRMGRGKRSASS